MGTERENELVAARLTTAVAGIEDGDSPAKVLASLLIDLDPDEAGPAIGTIVNDSCTRIDAAVTFLALLDRPSLEGIIPGWEWGRFGAWFSGTTMETAWEAVARMDANSRTAVLAKVSLLLEISYILATESVRRPEDMDTRTGADLALEILKGRNPGDDKLEVVLNSYPIEARSSLRGVLSELDFIEERVGRLDFTFSAGVMAETASGRNLSSHEANSPLAQALAGRRAMSLVKRLDLLTRSLMMFPSGHPSVKPSLESFLSLLKEFISGEEQVTLSLVGDSVMVNSVRVDRKSTAAADFARSMMDRKVNSITFLGELTEDDVMGFTGIYNKPPAYLEEHGGMARLLELRGLDRISVNRFHYELMSDEESGTGGLTGSDLAVEDAIFMELIGRLEKGESLESMSGEAIGQALKKILEEADNDRGRERVLLARFISALDPTLLEKGLLSSRSVQRGMAWGAIRTIIAGHLEGLRSEDPDVRHSSLGGLQEMALLAVDRTKENSVLQVIENVSTTIRREGDPDVLYRAVSTMGALQERLLATGMTGIAMEAGRVLSELESVHFSRTEMESARVRSLEEARRSLDTMAVADELVERLLSDDRDVSREAGRLALSIPPGCLVTRLVDVFHSDDRHLRAKAFRILLNFRKRALPVLHEKLEEVRDPVDTARDTSTGMLADHDWFQARNIVQVLRDIRSDESAPLLERLCGDPDPRMRRESLLALMKVSRHTADSLAPNLLADPAPEVAKIALNLLTRMASSNPASTGHIIHAYARKDIRPAVMKILDHLGDQPSVREFLLSGFTDPGDPAPFGDGKAASSALSTLAKFGEGDDAKVLDKYLHGVEGGFLRKKLIDKELLNELKRTLTVLKRRTEPN